MILLFIVDVAIVPHSRYQSKELSSSLVSPVSSTEKNHPTQRLDATDSASPIELPRLLHNFKLSGVRTYL